MRARLTSLWDQLRSSYWFVPSLMMLAAVGMALGAIALDAAREPQDEPVVGWLYGGGPDGAREVLSTIAGSLITMASLVFSITIVALTLASQQFGPRLLRNFLRDRSTQAALGTFTATFLYCLLVLRTISGLEGAVRVPHLSVTLGVALAFVSVAMLIYFIHHVSTSIQADTIIASVSHELQDAMDRFFPAETDRTPPAGPRRHPDFESDGVPLRSPATGYIQVMDLARLVELAAEHDVVIGLDHRPGHFVIQGAVLAQVLPAAQAGDKVREQLADQIVIGDQRTMLQDVEFGVDQLVEIALRALSPGVNDPFTAMRCIDELSAMLCRCARASWPRPELFDQEGQLRLVARRHATFESLVGTSFNQLRQVARSHAAVTIRLLEALAMIVQCCRSKSDCGLLLAEARMIREGAHEALPQRYDKDVVEERYRGVIKAAARSAGEEES